MALECVEYDRRSKLFRNLNCCVSTTRIYDKHFLTPPGDRLKAISEISLFVFRKDNYRDRNKAVCGL